MIVIGIAGGTGSGKSTVVRNIIGKLTGDDCLSIVPLDSYYKAAPIGVPLKELKKKNYDHPDAFDWELLHDQIALLKEGKSIEQPVYSMLTCDRTKKVVHVEPHEVVIVEGILSLCNEEVRKLMDLRLYVDADADERLIRVIKRDVVERGRTAQEVMDRYLNVLKPMHEQFIEPTKRYADLIIPQGGNNRKAIEIVRTYIEKLLLKNTL